VHGSFVFNGLRRFLFIFIFVYKRGRKYPASAPSGLRQASPPATSEWFRRASPPAAGERLGRAGPTKAGKRLKSSTDVELAEFMLFSLGAALAYEFMAAAPAGLKTPAFDHALRRAHDESRGVLHACP
jgi:hypothetical protein